MIKLCYVLFSQLFFFIRTTLQNTFFPFTPLPLFFSEKMSLLDDYMESSEAAHGTPTIQFGAEAFASTNGFDGLENVRVCNFKAVKSQTRN